MSDPIEYTGTFKTMQDVVDWINNYEPAPSEDPRWVVRPYVDINGNTVNAMFQVLEESE